MSEKICPILAIAGSISQSGSSPCQCRKEKCALWVNYSVPPPLPEKCNKGHMSAVSKDCLEAGHCGLIRRSNA